MIKGIVCVCVCLEGTKKRGDAYRLLKEIEGRRNACGSNVDFFSQTLFIHP